MTCETFVAGRGPLYRIDPRSKVLALLLVIVWCFLPVRLPALWVLVAALLGISLASVGWRATLGVFRSILAMLVFMVVFLPLAARNGEPLVLLRGFVLVTREGLGQTLRLMGRFVAITYGCSLLFSTTRMHDIMLALASWHLPYAAVLVVSLTFASIPFIGDTFREIQDSHKLREASDGKSRTRLKDLLPTLTSALVAALRSIPFMAMSLEQRGYGRAGARTSYHDFSSWRHGGLCAFLAVALFVLGFLAGK